MSPLPCWVARVCEHLGWLLATAGRALSPCYLDGLGGVATRRVRALLTSNRNMQTRDRASS